jgi:anaerobic magnesium-protoporphyrin IX monomethyl ester cyclase
MKRAGLTKINFGIESGDPETLKRFHRDIPLETIRQAVRWSREEGIITLGFFMVGLPGEDWAGLERTRRFALELGCDFVQVNKFVPQPPSELYQELVKKTGVDYWREYTLGDAGILEKIPVYNPEMDSKFLDEWQRKFFRSYYYRPAYVLSRIRKIKSWREFAGLARAALAIR